MVMFQHLQSALKSFGRFYGFAIVLGLMIFGSAVAKDANMKPIKVLIVDGYSNHDWKETTKVVSRILKDTGLFEIEVSTAPSVVDSAEWKKWLPKFSRYDVVIQNTNNIQDKKIRWPHKAEVSLEKYVNNGGGLFIYHSANNAFDHWKQYDKMIGLGWRNKEQGTAIEITEDGKIVQIPPGQGKWTSHGPRLDTVIRVLKAHPINKDYPKSWITPSLEVYTHARGPAENLTVLSYAYDKPTEKYWPIEWVVKYGKGRVYNSTLGHLWEGETSPASIRCAGFQTTLIRAAEWLAKEKVTWKIPGNFPDAEKVSVVENYFGSKFHSFTMNDIDGNSKALADYQGKVLLIVNVASKCGYTGQYASLQQLYDKYKDKGLVILGFPANNFGSQEPGTDLEIKEFCTTTFNVTFPMFSKISVKGKDIHPLYRYLTSPEENGKFGKAIKWNFNKFLIGKDGSTIARYPSGTKPMDPKLISALEKAL